MRLHIRAVRLKLALCAFLTLTVLACGHPPPSLTPAGALVYQANQVVVAIGEIQHVAISLNGVSVCETAIVTTCHPLLSEANTRVVVEVATDALNTMRQVPAGWKATALAALDRIDQRLDAAGQSQLKPYVGAARAIIAGQ